MFGEPLQRLESTDSTNRVALEWVDAPHGAAVVAEQQTAGRGRLGREWVSPAGDGLYLSVVLRPPAGAELAKLALVAALAATAAVREVAGLAAWCKWPNDVLIADGAKGYFKVGGILCETRTDSLGARVVVGIGINVNQTAERLPDRPQFPAASLAMLAGANFEVEAVLQAVLAQLGEKAEAFFQGEGTSLLREFNGLCAGLGEVVRVAAPDGTILGVAQEIDADGFLLVRTVDGVKRVVAGDVSYL